MLIERVRAERAVGIEMLGVVASMVERDETASLAEVRKSWTELTTAFDAGIPRATELRQAEARRLPVSFLPDGGNEAVRAFEALAAEVEERIKGILLQDSNQSSTRRRFL